MHARLAWVDGTTLTADNLTKVANDIIAVLTGETNENNLSTVSLPGGTSISSIYPAGWEIYDSGAGIDVTYPDAWILRAPTVDDPTQYKYLKLAFRSSSNYIYIRHQVMESWDSGTNTATNICTVDDINYVRFPPSSYNGNTLEIIATARFIWLRTNDNLYTCSFPAMEISRNHPCFAIGSGYVPVVQMQNNAFAATNFTGYYASVPRVIDAAGTADLTSYDIRCTNGGGRGSTNVSNEFDNLTSEIAYDNASNPSYGVQQIIFERRETIGAVLGDSTVADVFIMQGGVVAGFEDRTLHDLDATLDRRCMWHDESAVTAHGDLRYIMRTE